MESVKKIIVIGSRGMAGHVIYNYLIQNTSHKVIDIAKANGAFSPAYNLDVTNFSKLGLILKNEKPDIVINCIGILNQEAENHPDNAILINSYLPHYLANVGKDLNFNVIHISTDCVFNGLKGNYTENSEKDGYGFYAQSKALGELQYGNNLTIRTSIIGPEIKQNGTGLFNWFMNQNGEINGYTLAYWTGVTTIELSKAIVAAINQNIKGLHHLVNDVKISKYQLLLLIKEVFAIDNVKIKEYDNYFVDKSLVKTKSEFDYVVHSYKTMIGEMKIWMLQNKDLYSHYKLNE